MDERIECPCLHCSAKLRVALKLAGMTVKCPKCGKTTPVPEADEVTTYTLGAKKDAAPPEPDDTPLEEWWPDGKKLKLPSDVRESLDMAKEYIEEERWKKALRELSDAYRDANETTMRALRRPVGYCLAGLVRRELEKFKESGAKLSEGFRAVLKTAAELHKWGGTFNIHECAACNRQLPHLEGTLQLRTAAGSAYLCCTGPTKNDVALVQAMDMLWQLLALAGRINPDDADGTAVMRKLPWWYRALLTREFETAWCKQVISDEGWGNTMSSLLAEGAINGIFSAMRG